MASKTIYKETFTRPLSSSVMSDTSSVSSHSRSVESEWSKQESILTLDQPENSPVRPNRGRSLGITHRKITRNFFNRPFQPPVSLPTRFSTKPPPTPEPLTSRDASSSVNELGHPPSNQLDPSGGTNSTGRPIAEPGSRPSTTVRSQTVQTQSLSTAPDPGHASSKHCNPINCTHGSTTSKLCFSLTPTTAIFIGCGNRPATSENPHSLNIWL